VSLSPASNEAADLLRQARAKFCLDPVQMADQPCDTCELGRGTGRVAMCKLRMTEVSAIQSQLIKMAKDPSEEHRNWRAEYQGEPRPPSTRAVIRIGAGTVIEARSGLHQRVVAEDTDIIVQGRDVGRHEIHTVTMAISPGRVCRIIDYYTTPVESPTGRVDRDTPEGQATQLQIEAAIRSAIGALASADRRTTFIRTDGAKVGITLTGYDSRWAMHVVRSACFKAGQQWNLPIMGMGTAKGIRPWSVPRGLDSGKVARKPRERVYQTHDHNTYSRWVSIGPEMRNGPDRLVLSLYAHSDWYKSNVHAGFAMPAGEPGSLSIFDPVNEETGEIYAGALHSRYHAKYAAHITAEQEEEVVPGSALTRWVKVKGREANHYLDSTYICLSLASVIESIIAPEIRLAGTGGAIPIEKPKVKTTPEGEIHRTIATTPVKQTQPVQAQGPARRRTGRGAFRRNY